MINWLLNIASVCFFIAEVIKMHRKWRAKKKMDSTSLEGTIIHTIGNFTFAVLCIFSGAWIAVFAELTLAISNCVAIYWKTKWLVKKLAEKSRVKRIKNR